MQSTFVGFPVQGMRFLRALKKNNDREWFQPRKGDYEQYVKAPMLELIAAVNRAMARFAPDYVSAPAKAVFRLYRDTRFSQDKTPYKTNIAAALGHRAGSRFGAAGFYVSVSPEQIGVGGGLYRPAPETLRLVRDHVIAHENAFRKTFEARRVRNLLGDIQGEPMTRVPKGYDPEHPAEDLLRCRQFLLYTNLDPKIATTPELETEVITRFKAIAPFVEFLNVPIVAPKRTDPLFR